VQEAEESTSVEAVARKRSVKTIYTEDTSVCINDL
jgi:hypothetical protein